MTPTPGISNGKRWLIVIATMSATLMQVLDMTIVNVALPHIQGSLSAASDQISWTLTSYLVASAIFMPLTGYFCDRLGRKKYLLICIGGFTIASALCGASVSLLQIILFRLLQGVFGAALVPLSQAILADVFPPEDRGKAMAIWGIGVMVGPILGPTLGGYLTEIASWRWTFYVNVPIGILSLVLAWQVVPDTLKKERSMDWVGLALISMAIGGLQYFFDRGNQQDWFSANDIRVAMFICVGGLIGFFFHTRNRPPSQTVFDMRIFKNRNFTISSLMLAAMGLGMFGTMVIQPLMLENLLNYPVLMTGLLMAPRGISGMVSMMFVGKLVGRVDPRFLITFGILLSVAGISAGTFYSQTISTWWIVWPLLLQGFGLSMIFVPLTTVAFSTLPDSSRVEAAGLFSLLRTIGSSIGISITITLFSRYSQMAWNQIGGNIQPYNPALQDYLSRLNLNMQQPESAVLLGGELLRQSQMVAFVNVYAFIMWSFLLMLPLVLLLKKNTKTQSSPTLTVAD
jgi:DHA2 family multidrug resistance protein